MRAFIQPLTPLGRNEAYRARMHKHQSVNISAHSNTQHFHCTLIHGLPVAYVWPGQWLCHLHATGDFGIVRRFSSRQATVGQCIANLENTLSKSEKKLFLNMTIPLENLNFVTKLFVIAIAMRPDGSAWDFRSRGMGVQYQRCAPCGKVESHQSSSIISIGRCTVHDRNAPRCNESQSPSKALKNQYIVSQKN